MEPTIKYNKERSLVGIYLNKELIIDGEDLLGITSEFAEKFYFILKQRLERIRLPNENWIESVSLDTNSGMDDDIPF